MRKQNYVDKDIENPHNEKTYNRKLNQTLHAYIDDKIIIQFESSTKYK